MYLGMGNQREIIDILCNSSLISRSRMEGYPHKADPQRVRPWNSGGRHTFYSVFPRNQPCRQRDRDILCKPAPSDHYVTHTGKLWRRRH